MTDNQISSDDGSLEDRVDSPNNLKFLIVDDDEDVRNSLSEILGSEGYQIVTAKNGFEARKILNTEGSSLKGCILDLLIPGNYDPVDMEKTIRGNYPHINIIFMSGKSIDDEDTTISKMLRKYSEKGRFFPKPLDFEKSRSNLISQLTFGKSAPCLINPKKDIDNLLIVDDDPEYIDKIKRGIGNINIDSAKTALNAYYLFNSNNYDAMIFNLILSKKDNLFSQPMDGMKCIERIRKKDPETPILTTSGTSLFVPPPDLGCYHFQKGVLKESGEKIPKYLLGILKGEKDPVYDLYNHPAMRSALEFVSDLQGYIRNKDIRRLETQTGINLEKMIHDEVHYTAMGAGGREKGYITEETAAYALLLREFVCRELGKKEGISDFQEKMWDHFNKSQETGQPCSIRESIDQVISKEKRREEKRAPYIIVLAGPSGSGKTTLAEQLEQRMNEDRDTVWIGNIKTGEPRKKEMEKGKDIYVSEAEADQLEDDPRYDKYKFFGKRYFQKTEDVKEAFLEGNDVILVRNKEGLETAEETVYKYNMEERKNEDPYLKLISFMLHAGEDELRNRLRERAKRESRSDKEMKRRNDHLSDSLKEYNETWRSYDYVISTNQPIEDTIEDIMSCIDEVDEENPYLHIEFKNYARTLMRKLTIDRYSRLADFEKEVKKRPVTIPMPETASIPEIQIAAAGSCHGTYTFCLNPFYSHESSIKMDFIQYLEETFGQKAERYKAEHSLHDFSEFGQSTIKYKNHRRAMVDDIAVFTLNKGVSRKFSEGEVHTAAFVSLEKRIESGNYVIIKGI